MNNTDKSLQHSFTRLLGAVVCGASLTLSLSAVLTCNATAAELRLGIIGTDTSHALAFTEILNNEAAKDHVPGARIVAAFAGGSPDIPMSIDRVHTNAAVLRDKYGVKLCDTIEDLCSMVDGVLIESVDGRPHLAQARKVIAAKKPLFIDKPLAGSLEDALTIIELAKKADLPLFSSSSLRYGKNTQAVRGGKIGKVLSAETTSPAAIEPHHPDLYWYGVHGCESLFTVMGTGCESVLRTNTPDGKIKVIGTWSGGRRGTFREDKTYGGNAVGEKGESPVGGYDKYTPLVVEIVKFFETHRSPVPIEETIELFAFMSGADESKRLGGKPVKIADVLKKARANMHKK